MRGVRFWRLAAVAFVFCSVLGAGSADARAESPEADGSPKERTQLTGDWGGARSRLAAHGIIVDFHATQFYQGVVDGSSGTNDWQYGVKGDLFLTLIGEKLGLWKGLIGIIQAETRSGDDVNAISGLSPGNVNMLMPNSDDVTAITHVLALQKVAKQTALAVGKINAFTFVDMLVHNGRGVDGFMNTSLVLPIGLGGTVPLALPFVGPVKFKGKEIQGLAGIYDPNDCATTSCLDPFFEDPSAIGVWKFYTGNGPEGARAGYIAIGGTYSSKEYKVVDPGSFFVNPALGLAGFSDTQQSWSVFSIVNHELWADLSDPDRFLNFRGMYTITDGEANPIKWSATAALEMTGPFRRRDKDVFGIGIFHAELASGFKNAVGPLLSLAATIKNRRRTRINIEDTDGFEAYYKAQVTPWFAVTGDVQVITETLSSEDRKVVAGVRGKVTF